MILKAILSNKAHQVYGQATIPLPIPNSDYDQTVTLLEAMDIGSPTGRTAGWTSWTQTTPFSTGW